MQDFDRFKGTEAGFRWQLVVHLSERVACTGKANVSAAAGRGFL